MAKKPATTPKIGAHDGIPKGRGRLEGKVALVMGGGSILPGWGNGKAAAVLFAIEGAKVFVVDLRKAAAEETVDIIEQAGGHAVAAAGDATSEKDVARVVAACLAKLGRIDVLHNNVGGQGTGRALETITLDDWNEYMARNVTSAMLSCREVVPAMLKQAGGAIVNVSSIGSLRHLNTPMAVYAAGKGAINAFTQNIALQYAGRGIRANCVLPGDIDTPFSDRHRQRTDRVRAVLKRHQRLQHVRARLGLDARRRRDAEGVFRPAVGGGRRDRPDHELRPASPRDRPAASDRRADRVSVLREGTYRGVVSHPRGDRDVVSRRARAAYCAVDAPSKNLTTWPGSRVPHGHRTAARVFQTDGLCETVVACLDRVGAGGPRSVLAHRDSPPTEAVGSSRP